MRPDSVFARVAKPHAINRTSVRVNNMKISPIKEMELLAAEFGGAVSLGQGTPSFATPDHIREFVKEKISEGFTDKYSLGPGVASLRDAVACKLERRNKIHANPQTEILVTAGANEGLSIAMLAMVNQGDEVLVTSPSYSPHIEQIKMAGGTPIYVALREDKRWELDVDDLTRAVTPRTKAIVLSTPVNPTGSLITEKSLKLVADVALRHSLFLVTDETYEDFIYVDRPHFSVGSLSELKDLAVSVFSFSKSYALTGWRCGYVVANEGMINQLLKLHDAICICTSLTAQFAALAALTGPQDCICSFRDQLLRRQELVLARIKKLARYECVCPEGAYYVLPKVQEVDDSLAYCLTLLKQEKVVLVPGGAFGPTGEGHVRISYCMAEATINEAFDRIERFEKAAAR
jgi:aminotransferase